MTSELNAVRPKKRRAVQVLIALALVVYALLYAEVFLRIFSPQAVMPRYVTGTSWGVRGNIPNSTYWHYTPEVTVQYHINSQGMRADHDYSFIKPPATCRVALYGDSFFVGYELPLAQTFAVRLEQALQASGVRAEVLNFSVSGFGQGEMLKSYEAFGRRFDPDVVLFEWQDTDPTDNVRSGLFRLENGTVKAGKTTYLPGIAVQDVLMRSGLYRLVADHSQLYTFVRDRTALFVKRLLLARAQTRAKGGGGSGGGLDASGEKEPPAEVEPQPQGPSDHPAMDLSAALLLYAQDLVHEEGRDFYVVSIPKWRSRTHFQSYAAALPPTARAGLVIIDPTDAFTRAAGPDRKVYYEQGAGHLTPMAVEVLTAETLAAIKDAPAFAACRTSPGGAAESGPPMWSQARAR